MVNKIEMAVLDIAGTTIKDNCEVENCFMEAANSTGLRVERERIISMMGWSKRQVFELLWNEQLPGRPNESIEKEINHSYIVFKKILEEHYNNTLIYPTEGCLALLEYLKSRRVKTCLTTGFYRIVTDIILNKTRWLYKNNGKTALVDFSVTSDEVPFGRPAPFMIFRAMEHCNVYDVRKVIKIGDTPSDLLEGKNAGCIKSFGVTNGSHTHQQLEKIENDGLFVDLTEVKQFLETWVN